MSIFHSIKYHLSYFLNAVNRHSLQSPFIYELYTKVIRSEKLNGDFAEIESLRNVLLTSNEKVKTTTFGAASKKRKSNTQSIKHVASGGLTSPKYSALLYRLVKHFHIRQIIELGTSFGINTLYLAKYEATKVTTFEGNNEIAEIAQTNFDALDASDINLIKGNIDQTLTTFLDGSVKPDLVYIDANHTFEATIRYFNTIKHDKHDKTIVILDDIKWSAEMQKAWKTIIADEEVTMSIDLNKCGMVFFNPDFTKQHFVLTF